MRVAFAMGCIYLSGCVAAPFSLESRPSQPMASLTMSAHPGDRIDPAYNGIWLVDDRKIPDGPVQSILVFPGVRKIDYICPGVVVLDGYQTTSSEFVAGERYEVNCEDESGIKVVGGGT